ncbi:MAG: TIGR03757 family integrating conjugative element protein [Rhodocyclaceae bacterium]|nr:TIGR03757 family integrating conjugative element protein [Rhodocyclaceae bacterium]
MKRTLTALVLVVAGLGSASGEAVRVEVFKLGAQRLTGVGDASVYEVDRLRGITQRLSIGLPADAKRAGAIARARFDAMSKGEQEELQHAARVVGQAAHYRIDKVPAIVFDGRAVVYGVTDLARARTIYRRWQEGRR